MEYLDVYNEKKELLGKTIVRTKEKPVLGPNEFIRIILIFIQNSNDELLIQYTSERKGNLWATTGGLVSAGDTSEKTVVKEVSEELGIDISSEDYKYIGDYKKGVAFFDIYYLKKDIDIDSLRVEPDEVDHVEWLTFDEIDNLISEDKFRPGNIPGLNLLKEYLNSKKISK